jgi:hypothetical protein
MRCSGVTRSGKSCATGACHKCYKCGKPICGVHTDVVRINYGREYQCKPWHCGTYPIAAVQTS